MNYRRLKSNGIAAIQIRCVIKRLRMEISLNVQIGWEGPTVMSGVSNRVSRTWLKMGIIE